MNKYASGCDVFLSYSHNDRVQAEKIAVKISEAGFSCWIDKDKLRAQENFNSAIDMAVDRAIVFIALLSKTYVSKPYCIHEFDRAIDKQKSILAVCIDDVREETNRQAAYLFSFSAGHNILGFGSGINQESDIDSIAQGIIDSVPLEMLRRFSQSGDMNDYPPVSTPDYMIARLRLYHEKQYQQSGNYALNEIRSELFPAIADTEMNVLYKDESRENVSLVKYFSCKGKTQKEKHILIIGEGGMGKTISLLKACEYLLSKRINAIYIPLSKINRDLTLDQYLERVVCGGSQHIWGLFRDLMSVPYNDVPNVVLLLDGINEISLDYIDAFKGFISTMYINSYSGVKLVMTSRWFDNSLMHSLEKNITLLEMQGLDRESIDLYLISFNIPRITNEKILSIIKTPLMLTLFADVESHKDKYRNIDGIVLEDNPDTVGKILSNFFQTQLYRAAEEENFDRGTHLALLEYFLPKAAFIMLRNHSLHISKNELRECIREMKDDEERFRWYLDDKWSWVIRGRTSVNIDGLRDLAETGLHFLNKMDDSYEFLHQSFRDYFAAYFIAGEIWAYRESKRRFNAEESVIGKEIYPPEILSFVSDIIREENSCPKFIGNGYEFPGRNSEAEFVLSLWRGKEGEFAQNAVANLVNIMKTGRQNILAGCDFSGLDMRKCRLNGCQFTVWHEEKFYPSKFDGACLNRENFLTNGHEAQVSVIVFDGESRIYSGDMSGLVKIYSLTEHLWIDRFHLLSDAVIDIALSRGNERIAILYENTVFCCSLRDKTIVGRHENMTKSRNFRYVRFSDDDEINVSFDMEPLIWCRPNGETLPSGLDYDVPAKCARWNPRRKEFIRSNLLQLLSVNRFDEKSSCWTMHPALKNKPGDNSTAGKSSKDSKETQYQYLSLRDIGASSGSVSCIQYSEDGAKVLIAVKNMLAEYDTETLDVLNRKDFPSNVACACYTKNGIAIGIDTSIIFLDSDFAEEYALRGSQIKPIIMIRDSYDGNGYYMLSSNGELKKLDQELTVQSMRYVDYRSLFMWVRDRLTDKIQMAFLPFGDFPFGARYTYDEDIIEPLGWRYEFLDSPSGFSEEDKQQFYNMHSSIMVIEKIPPYRKIEYTNYAGICIFGCSFGDIRGDMTKRGNMNFLIQNGGIIDGGSQGKK